MQWHTVLKVIVRVTDHSVNPKKCFLLLYEAQKLYRMNQSRYEMMHSEDGALLFQVHLLKQPGDRENMGAREWGGEEVQFIYQ